jgi:hypothetical protein
MPPADIPFPVTTAPGAHPHNSAGRLINVYAEDLVNGARSRTVWRRSPGLVSHPSNPGVFSNWRGGLVVGGALYGAWGSPGRVTSMTPGYVYTTMGNLAGTRRVFWAKNNKGPPDVVVVDPDNGAFVVTTAPAVVAYPDADVGAPNSVCFLDGYFFFTHGDGTVLASGINSTAINPLDFIVVYGNDQGLLRAVPYSELYLFGSHVTEVWQNTAQPTGFPFSRVKVIPRGLLGRNALTGWEPGFSKGLFFVGNDMIVYSMQGYAPVKISTPDVDRMITNYVAAGGDLEALEMFCYVVGGRSCVAVRTPTFCWVFDIEALRWHERTSPGSISIPGITTWRAYASVFFNDLWLTGDSLVNQRLTEISASFFKEPEGPTPAVIESGPVTAFPNRLRVAQASFDIARGVGITTGLDPSETNPTVLISWSDDGGMNWSNPVQRKLGQQQTSPGVVRVNRAGQTKDQGRRWRVTVYDGVDVELTGGKMDAEIRNY